MGRKARAITKHICDSLEFGTYSLRMHASLEFFFLERIAIHPESRITDFEHHCTSEWVHGKVHGEMKIEFL